METGHMKQRLFGDLGQFFIVVTKPPNEAEGSPSDGGHSGFLKVGFACVNDTY